MMDFLDRTVVAYLAYLTGGVVSLAGLLQTIDSWVFTATGILTLIGVAFTVLRQAMRFWRDLKNPNVPA